MTTSSLNVTSDLIELHNATNLYLKPIARVNITVQVPGMKQLSMSKAISNWEVMEKLRTLIQPLQFIQLKVVKSTLEFIRFQAELDTKSDLIKVINRLDSQVIKLSGFPDNLRVRSSAVKLTYPTRHDWDAFFRDAKDMDESKAGERPDTLHISGLPTRWFAENPDSSDPQPQPSLRVFASVFEVFGEVIAADIPSLDPYRGQMGGHITPAGFHDGQLGLTFNGYIQYSAYLGFVRAMDALRGMKLVRKLGGSGTETDTSARVLFADIKVDFDQTKHLSDQSIRKRRLERDKFLALEAKKVRQEEQEKRRQEDELRRKERQRLEEIKEHDLRRKAREEKRRKKVEDQKRYQKELLMQRKIAMEERKILIANRKLQSIRLLSYILLKVKVEKEKDILQQKEKELELERLRQIELERQKKEEKEKKRILMGKRKKDRLETQEKELREKILKNLRDNELKKEIEERERLRKCLAGRKRLKSVFVVNTSALPDA